MHRCWSLLLVPKYPIRLLWYFFPLVLMIGLLYPQKSACRFAIRTFKLHALTCLPSVLLLMTLFNDRLENTKKLLAHAIYSLKVGSATETILPLLTFGKYLSSLLVKFLRNGSDTVWVCCSCFRKISDAYFILISYKMVLFALNAIGPVNIIFIFMIKLCQSCNK